MHAWWQLLRASNLPTVWTNVLLGAFLSLPAGWMDFNGKLGLLVWAPFALLLIAGTCAYLGGMVMNDIVDLEHDRSIGADRPLVHGRITKRAATAAMITLVIASIWAQGAAIWLTSNTWQPALMWLALLAAIWLYNLLHRRSAILAAFLMASCRGTLVLAAAATTGTVTMPAGIAAAAVACWTAGITLLARGERGGEPRVDGWLVLLLIAALGPVGVYLSSGDAELGPLLGGLLVLGLAWIPAVVRFHRAHQQGRAIVWAIMGLCVLDAACFMAGGHLVLAGLAMVAMALCMGLQRLEPGT